MNVCALLARVIFPPTFGLIAANSAPLGSSPDLNITAALPLDATTNFEDVTNASVNSAVVPVIVNAPVAVTVPPVIFPIPDNTVASTVPVSVIVTSPFAITALVSAVTNAAVSSVEVPVIVIPAEAAVTVPFVSDVISVNVVAAIFPPVSETVTLPV